MEEDKRLLEQTVLSYQNEDGELRKALINITKKEQKAEFRKMIEEELKELSGTESIEKIERYVKSFEEPKKTKELFESYNVYQLAVLLKLLAKLEDNQK